MASVVNPTPDTVQTKSTVTVTPNSETYKETKIWKGLKVTTCTPGDAARWAIIALIVVAAIVGVGGLLVYLGKLGISLQNVGTMSQATGLYTMLGGFGLAFVTGVLYGIYTCVKARRDAGLGHA